MSVHINYGFAKRRCPERPKCMYCNKRRTWVAFTYFGAPVCGDCWDTKWRHPDNEDGACDPPFDAIENERQCVTIGYEFHRGNESATAARERRDARVPKEPQA